jgi:hypothetical protein
MTDPAQSPIHVQAAALLRGTIHASDTEPAGSAYRMPDFIRATFEVTADRLERHGRDLRETLGLPDTASDDAVTDAVRQLLPEASR